jgi:hypothetical protein
VSESTKRRNNKIVQGDKRRARSTTRSGQTMRESSPSGLGGVSSDTDALAAAAYSTRTSHNTTLFRDTQSTRFCRNMHHVGCRNRCICQLRCCCLVLGCPLWPLRCDCRTRSFCPVRGRFEVRGGREEWHRVGSVIPAATAVAQHKV